MTVRVREKFEEAADLEDGGRSHVLRNAGDLWKLEKRRKPILFWRINKEWGLADTLLFVQ